MGNKEQGGWVEWGIRNRVGGWGIRNRVGWVGDKWVGG